MSLLIASEVFWLAIALARGPGRSVENQQDPQEHQFGIKYRHGRSRGLGLGKGAPLGHTWETQVVLGGCWACGSFKKSLKWNGMFQPDRFAWLYWALSSMSVLLLIHCVN